MKNRKVIITAIQIVFLLSATLKSQAWNGDKPFQMIYRETILKTANQMIGFSWTPNITIHNWEYYDKKKKKPKHYDFKANFTYYGEAYSQINPQDSWTGANEFYEKVNSVTYDKNTNANTMKNTYFGNDCAGFVSMSWKLPGRLTTSEFKTDATGNRKYCYKLENMDNLLPGDALVAGGTHMVLFHSYFLDTEGQKKME